MNGPWRETDEKLQRQAAVIIKKNLDFIIHKLIFIKLILNLKKMSEKTLRNRKTLKIDDIMTRLIAMEAASKTLETIQQDQKLLIVANEDIKKEIQDVKQNYGDMNIDLQSTKKKITGISVTVETVLHNK
jgi:hypothetical protein